MTLNNDRGNITLLGSTFLLLAISIMALFILQERKNFQIMKRDIQEQICMKKLIKNQTKMIKEVERINDYLFKISIGQAISIFIPALQGAALNAQKIKKALITYQQLNYLYYVSIIKNIFNESCPKSVSLITTPYEHKLFKLNRDKLTQEAKLRKTNWKEIWIGRNTTYYIDMKVKDQNLEVKSRRIRI